MADYAAALLAELRPTATSRSRRADCDIALYHLGNNALHAEIYRRALEQPGVVVLHDAVLHHFLLGQLDRGAVRRGVRLQLRRVERGLARELWRGRAASGADERYFEYPMLKRIAERARAVVVHNPAAARIGARACARGAGRSRSRTCSRRRRCPSEADVMRYRQRWASSRSVPVRRFRLPAGIQAADGRAGGVPALHRDVPRPRC